MGEKLEVIRLQTERDEKAWAKYLESSPRASFYHQVGWKNVLEKSYGFKSYYLMATEDSMVKGILPLTLGKSLFFGSFLATGLYCSHGGVCAENQEAEDLLIREAIHLVQKTGVDYLEIKNYDLKRGDLLSKDHYCILVIGLNTDPQEVWRDKVHRYRRRDVKRAQSKGLSAEIGGLEYMDDYFMVLSRNLRDLGSPVHSYRFYETLFEEFEEQTRIMVVKKDRQTVAAVNLFFFKDTVYPVWGGSLKEYRNTYPNELMYWRAIEYSCEKGYRYFDFGRSRWNSGTFKFKSRWGAEPRALFYQYYLNKGKDIPDVDPTNPRYQLYIAIWKRLPLFVTNWIGPKIIRFIP